MCGRYTVFTEADIIEMREIINEVGKRFGDGAVNAMKTGEIFPTNLVPILGMEDDLLAPRPAKWGFPKWDGKGSIINARADTVLKLPTFSDSWKIYRSQPPKYRSPILERRCVIPSTGFYEWKHINGKSTGEKFLLRLPDNDMVYMAGIANLYTDADGNPYEAYCIITTDASKTVREIHDRMPVILTPDEHERWIADNGFMKSVLARKGPELVLSQVA